MELRQETVTVNDLEVAYLACGDEGPLAVCLHGFPDTAWTWRHLLPLLADAGQRGAVVADGAGETGGVAQRVLHVGDVLVSCRTLVAG